MDIYITILLEPTFFNPTNLDENEEKNGVKKWNKYLIFYSLKFIFLSITFAHTYIYIYIYITMNQT